MQYHGQRMVDTADMANEPPDEPHLSEEEEEAGRQRRENVRVSVQIPLTVTLDGHPTYRGRTRDMSATGVGFATRLPVETGDSGSLTVHFDEFDLEQKFVVRFVKPILAGRQVGVQFDELTADEREKLVKAVFAIQRQQLREKQRLI